MYKNKRISTYIHIITLLMVCNSVVAQEQTTPYCSSNNSTLFGIGGVNLYDTYLSPLKYDGISFRIINERMKRMSWFDNKFSRQQTIDINISSADNPAKNATEYSIIGDYRLGGHYNLYKSELFKLSGGALFNINGGVIYNQRNSNNPASAKLNSNINLSVIGFYYWKNLTFRGQLDSPIAGVLFSPHYGQSYYEISLGNSVGVVNFASLHNQRALRSYFTVDIPISKISLRVGYMGSFYQTRVHNITSHIYSNNFVIGLVSESINISGSKIKETKIINSSYY